MDLQFLAGWVAGKCTGKPFVTPWTVACQAPLSMEFSRILEWVATPSSRDLPDPGIKPTSPVSPALACGFFTPEPPGKPRGRNRYIDIERQRQRLRQRQRWKESL